MASIAFLLLCHKDPEAIVLQANQLTAAGDCIAIHFDARAKPEAFEKIRSALADNPRVAFARRRVKCGWGEWSLVEATLLALEAAEATFPRATHFYMVSGDCMAIKSARYAHDFLDNNDADYIESFDFFESDWIKTGIKEERLIYRHYFNERNNKRLFYASLKAQKALRLTREVPDGMQIMIGSQWWCLRRETVEKVLRFVRNRPDVTRFFRTTWIPDETFFQTIVRHLIPGTQIRSRTLTFLMFTDYGMPATIYNDHYDMLLGQDALFARKISPEALDLKERLGALYASNRESFQISDEGRTLFRFLTGKGRIGQRFAPRFWEAEGTIGRDRELLILICKKWHVAKRLAEQIRAHTDIPAVEYLFNEQEAGLPALGGIESTLRKRMRHRRALMRMLLEYFETNRLVLCVDPSDFDLLRDLSADRAIIRLLEIQCGFNDSYLTGHAHRVGLAGEQTPPESLARLLPTLRNDIALESDRIADEGFEHLYRLRENAPPEENAQALAAFLALPSEQAREMAQTPHLFSD